MRASSETAGGVLGADVPVAQWRRWWHAFTVAATAATGVGAMFAYPDRFEDGKVHVFTGFRGWLDERLDEMFGYLPPPSFPPRSNAPPLNNSSSKSS